MRAALYARFSTDNQNPLSTADQLALCRRFADRAGYSVVREYCDDAVSGWATGNRPDFLSMMADAEAGLFDVVVCEHIDRMSRGLTGTPEVFEDLRDLGIAIDGVNQGRITTVLAAASGMVSAVQIEEGARKTRRGLAGVVQRGRSAGGRSYGYRKVRSYDAAGEPIRGLREIEPAEAKVVVRVFEAYAAGTSPRAIAAALNAEGIPSPRGGLWNASTINGNAARGNGLLHNRLYAGEVVWGRQTWIKNRRTGKRRGRLGQEAERVTAPAPKLRIVGEDLWQAVQARVAALALGPQDRPESRRRPVHLLSGLVRCEVCKGSMVVGGSGPRLACATRREKGPGACSNARTALVAGVETRVLDAVREQLLHPEVIEEAVREVQAEERRLRLARLKQSARFERELADVTDRASRLVDRIAGGLPMTEAVKQSLLDLEARRVALQADLGTQPPEEKVERHPAAAGQYRRWVEELQAHLTDEAQAGDDQQQAREAFRQLVQAVWFIPLNGRGQFRLEIDAETAALLSRGGRSVPVKVGAGTGFEPVTFRL